MRNRSPVFRDGVPETVNWPFPVDEFVRASRLVEDGASDQEVRAAVREVEE